MVTHAHVLLIISEQIVKLFSHFTHATLLMVIVHCAHTGLQMAFAIINTRTIKYLYLFIVLIPANFAHKFKTVLIVKVVVRFGLVLVYAIQLTM